MQRYAIYLLILLSGVCQAAPIRQVTLTNDRLQLVISPDIGGRVLHASLNNAANLLRVDSGLLAQGLPEVRADGSNVGYLGHIVWVGPQSSWWLQQRLNPGRRAARAAWPPDPYTVLAASQIVEQNPNTLVLALAESPVTGLSMTKTFRLSEVGNRVQLDVQANNRRGESVAWDLWFNTRVPADSTVLVPVTEASDVRGHNPFQPGVQEPVAYRLEQGVLALEQRPASSAEKQRAGKLFITPSANWLASFADDQVLIIRFDHVAAEKIHPEHALVELYMDYRGEDYAAGLIELEVHSAYHRVPAGGTLAAGETWTILPYSGADTLAARIRFIERSLGTEVMH